MALLQVKLPARASSSLLIEDIFYRRYPALRRVKLSTFYSLEKTSSILQVPKRALISSLARDPNLRAVEYQKQILIHPDSVIRIITNRAQARIKKLVIK